MNYIQKYKEYLQDNPEGYWFKRKLYGWGWTPAKWEGWMVIFIFLLLILLVAWSLGSNPMPTDWDIDLYFTKIILLVALLILVCYKKGEKPKWQWGKRKE
ncbi:hypothetical protein HY311_03785 [Candidatus Nomurabacteria bacterium]|nr:hypothetical protein [Candidatus Nomurabacteria bacterium]